MKTRTWPYGTTHRGKVLVEITAPPNMKGAHLVEDLDWPQEGHMLVNGAQDPTAKPGDTGTLTFTKGGPTGGYWRFQKDLNPFESVADPVKGWQDVKP